MDVQIPFARAAEIVGVHPLTLSRWSKLGWFRCALDTRGFRVVTLPELNKLADKLRSMGRTVDLSQVEVRS